MCVCRLRLCLTATPRTVAHQAPLSMGFSRQEHWSRLPFPPTGDLPNPGMELTSLMSPVLVGEFFTTSTTWGINKGRSFENEFWMDFPGGSEVKSSACNAGDLGSIPGSGRSPGEGNGNPLQYSCLENPRDGGAWWATVHGIAKSWTRLSNLTFTF